MNKQAAYSINILASILAISSALGADAPPRASITVRVRDEQGARLQGAGVTFTFFNPHTRNGVPVEGFTDERGEFSGEGFSDPKVGGHITMDGYYPSGFPFVPFRDMEENRWIPWNPTFETVMRKIGNPVALHAKSDWIEIPLENTPCGYDLEKGDWVTPFGNGVVADLMFVLERRYVSRQDFEVVVRMVFPQPDDGVQPAVMPESGKYSRFSWERYAPASGYQSELRTRFAHPKGGTYENTASSEDNYFFRVRTVSEKGQIVKANYGKIAGGLSLAPSNSKTCKIQLTYYFNPTPNDRNLEWDTTKNLIPNLGPMETPRDP